MKNIEQNIDPMVAITLSNGKEVCITGTFSKNIETEHVTHYIKKVDGKAKQCFEPEVCGEVALDGIIYFPSVIDGITVIDEKTEKYSITGSAPIKQKWGKYWDGPGHYYEWKGQLAYNPPIKSELKKYADYENGTVQTEAPIGDIEKLKEIFKYAF